MTYMQRIFTFRVKPKVYYVFFYAYLASRGPVFLWPDEIT